MTRRAYIFDLDGTLVDSAADVIAALGEAFSACGRPIPENLSTSLIGPPVREILGRVIPGEDEGEYARIAAAFRSAYDDGAMGSTRVYPGVREALEIALARGDSLFVATNKPQKPTMKVIERHLAGFFVERVSIDSLPGGRLGKSDMIARLIAGHDLRRAETRVIGDGAGDISAALSQGCRAIGALYGYGGLAELEGAGCSEFIARSEDLPEWIKEDA